jgi:hypothetical protein
MNRGKVCYYQGFPFLTISDFDLVSLSIPIRSSTFMVFVQYFDEILVYDSPLS